MIWEVWPRRSTEQERTLRVRGEVYRLNRRGVWSGTGRGTPWPFGRLIATTDRLELRGVLWRIRGPVVDVRRGEVESILPQRVMDRSPLQALVVHRADGQQVRWMFLARRPWAFVQTDDSCEQTVASLRKLGWPAGYPVRTPLTPPFP